MNGGCNCLPAPELIALVLRIPFSPGISPTTFLGSDVLALLCFIGHDYQLRAVYRLPLIRAAFWRLFDGFITPFLTMHHSH